MKRIILPSLITLLISLSSFSQSSPSSGGSKVTGTVKTVDGAVIAGMNLNITQDGQNRTFVSDINGDFELTLQSGKYVTVNKVNSHDFKLFLDIKEQGLNPDGLVLTFDPDRYCCSLGNGNSFARPTSLPEPQYPPAAVATRASGEVTVLLRLNSNGTVEKATAISGHPLLRPAATVAARASTFQSAAVAGDVTLTYVFQLPNTKQKNIRTYSNPYRIEIMRDGGIDF